MKTTMRVVFTLVILVLQLAQGQVSPHGTIKLPCQSCHTTDSWKMRRDAAFDHAQTGFILEGQHKSVDCATCHQALKFSGTSRVCTACHVDVHKSELGTNCARCHAQQTWKITDMVQRHQSTRFPLLGRHATLICQDCHAAVANNQYAGTPTTCIGCHRTDYEKSTNPNHLTAGFSTDCQQCHKVTSFAWSSGFDHSLTPFPLTGAHTSTACASCHKSASFKSTPTDCYVCHQVQYQSSLNPNHVSAGFPTTCKSCHATAGWKPSTFTHDDTQFPLTGAHRAVLCGDCHKNNQYSGLSANCVDCHRADYNGTTNPNHQTGGFSQTCTQCHSTTAWKPSSFDHSATKFALTGFHRTTPCQSCHTNSNYQLTYTDCYQCHQANYAGTTNPNHQTLAFPRNCTQCHTTSAWKPASFDHNTTKFQLTGAHFTTPCVSCHVNSNYQLVYVDCYTCHQATFASASPLNHVTNSINRNCTLCHTTTAWLPSTLVHDMKFRINSGKHIGQWKLCTDCHLNSAVYTDFTCINCHQHNNKAIVDSQHSGRAGYAYSAMSCYNVGCHRTLF